MKATLFIIVIAAAIVVSLMVVMCLNDLTPLKMWNQPKLWFPAIVAIAAAQGTHLVRR